MSRFLISMLLGQAKGPLPWIAVVLASLAWPLNLLFSPLTATFTGRAPSGAVYDVAFVFALAGALYADRRLERLRWLLARQDPSLVHYLPVTTLALGALLPAAVTLLPPALMGCRLSALDLAYLPLITLHIATILHLMTSLRFSIGVRSVGLLFLALVLPASIPSDAGPFSFLWHLLDPLAGFSMSGVNFIMYFTQMGSIVALMLCASCLRHTQPHQKAVHAIRGTW